MGSGGPRGLQNRCGGAFASLGGFDSFPLPPPFSPVDQMGSTSPPIAQIFQRESVRKTDGRRHASVCCSIRRAPLVLPPTVSLVRKQKKNTWHRGLSPARGAVVRRPAITQRHRGGDSRIALGGRIGQTGAGPRVESYLGLRPETR